MDEFHARDGMIRLGQLLKAAGLGGFRRRGEGADRHGPGDASTTRSRRAAGASCTPGDVVSVGDASVRLT